MSQSSKNTAHEKIPVVGNITSDGTVSIRESMRRPYQAVYLELTGRWGLTLQISIPSNFPFDLSMASLVCVL